MIELLLESKLIINRSENIITRVLKPQKEKIVLESKESYEGLGDSYYTVIQQDNKIMLYYRACNIPNLNVSHEYGRELEVTCYAESTNGLDFIKPNINKSTNIIFKTHYSHNFFPFMLPSKQIIGVGGTQYNTGGLLLLESKDNNWYIKCKLLDGSHLLSGWNHDNHFDSHNIVIYDPNYSHYKIYIRDNKPSFRHVQYTTTSDFKTFSEFKNVNFINYSDHIYTSGFFCYSESKYYLGFPSTHLQENANKKGMLMYSLNGHDWEMIDDNVCSDINSSYMIAHNMVIMNNKMFIYVRDIYKKQLIAYYYSLHRIQEISCSDVGTIKLGLFDLKIKQDIFINYKTNLYGFVQIEVLDSDNKIILSSEKLVGDEYIKKIVWFDNQHILLDGKYYINVILSNASLFSFKI
jgi:hypothetical protein